MTRRRPALVLFVALLLSACHQKDRFVGAPPANPLPSHGELGASSAIIAWKTDAPAGSLVEFGPTTGYGVAAGNPGERVTFHKVTLTGLPPSSAMQYRVRSLDNTGNTLYSYNRAFRTFPAGVTPGSYHRFNDDFEGSFEWTFQTFTDSQGVTSTVKEASPPAGGPGGSALVMFCNEQGQDANRSKGEVLLTAAAADRKIGDGVSVEFQDMTGKQLSAFVYPPSASAGNASFPNGIQLFVKDIYGNSQYGPYMNINAGFGLIPDTWTQIFMNVGGGGNSFTSPGFDPTLISTVGVKYSISTSVGPSVTYTGPLYVDNVAVTP